MAASLVELKDLNLAVWMVELMGTQKELQLVVRTVVVTAVYWAVGLVQWMVASMELQSVDLMVVQ
jgi:hypothetical protein